MNIPKFGVSYFGNRFPGHAHRDLVVISQCCDYVVHTVSETDLHHHKGALGKIFHESRKVGLEIWADPWGLGGVFGGESFSRFLLDHPDQWQRYSDGRPAPAACLNSRRFRDYVKEWIGVVADLGAQVIFWDEPHQSFTWTLEWEGVYSCVCSRCQDLFREATGGSLPARLGPEVLDFRRKTIKGFLEEVMAYARKKGLKNTLCLYAFEGYHPYEELWNDLASLPDLDIFGCDPYWRWNRGAKDPSDHVRHFAEKLLRTARPGQGSQLWIQAMRLPSGAEGEIGWAVRAAAEAGVTHVAAWSFDGGALLDSALSENPARVWAETSKVFSILKGT